MTTHALSTVIRDTRPFDSACIFYESTETALEALSFSKCVLESRTEKTLSALMFGGLITECAPELLGPDGASLGFVETKIKH